MEKVIDMAGITKKQISARRQRLLEELPNHGWDYVKAGIAVGYSSSYSKARLKKYAMKDSTFCQQVTVKRREIEAKTENLREKRLRRRCCIEAHKPATALSPSIDKPFVRNQWIISIGVPDRPKVFFLQQLSKQFSKTGIY